MPNRTRLNAAGLAALLVLSALAPAALPAAEEVAKLDESLYLGKPVVAQNVTVWPVYARTKAEVYGDLVTLTVAQEKGTAAIREVGAAPANAAAPANPPQRQEAAAPANAATPANPPQRQEAAADQQMERQTSAGGGATVGTLVIENTGSAPVLVLAGTLVKGGKQDRQIAQDFIIPPGKTVPVNAYCVEQGRWTATREGQDTGGKFVAQETLTPKAVRESGQYAKDQGEVWKNVSIANDTAGKAPGTGTLMATVEETDPAAKARREKIGGSVEKGFAELAAGGDAPVGLAYAVDGKVKVVQQFAHPKILNHYLPVLCNTIALEGDLAQRKASAEKKAVYEGAADAQQAVDLVQNAAKLKEECTTNSAGNENGSKQSEKVRYNRVSAEPAKDGLPAKNASETWSVAD